MSYIYKITEEFYFSKMVPYPLFHYHTNVHTLFMTEFAFNNIYSDPGIDFSI